MKPREPCTNTSQFVVASMATRDTAVLCCPWGPTLLFWKGAPACTAIWGDPIPGAGLCHFGQPAKVPLNSSPVLQPINHSPSLVSCRGASGSVYHPPIHSSRYFKRKKSPTSAPFCLFLKPEWCYTRGLLQSEIRMCDRDRLLWDCIDEAQKKELKRKTSSILVFQVHTDNARFLFAFKVHKFLLVLFAGNKA